MAMRRIWQDNATGIKSFAANSSRTFRPIDHCDLGVPAGHGRDDRDLRPAFAGNGLAN